MRDDQLEGLVLLSRFPVAFRLPALAFWSSCSRPGSWALLTVGLPANGRTPTGFPRFARTSCDRGGCPLYSGDNGAHPDRSRSPASVRRITATCPYAPPQHPIDTGLCFTKHQPRVQNDFTRPIFPSPVTPGWNRSPWAWAPSFAPRPYRRRTSRWGQAIEHEPETRSTSSTQPPILRVHSMRATSRRTRQCRSEARGDETVEFVPLRKSQARW